jgi:RNA 2',3'-cyclic 3'-phosphodiesterase
MKRLFAAIKISPDTAFLDQLEMIRLQLRHEKIKWVEEKNIHVTLKFFGETSEDKIPRIRKVLEGVAQDTPEFAFSLRNLGIFGSNYDPRVIWVGIDPYTGLASIMSTLRNKMEVLGFEADRQNLVPHLTLGRIKFLNNRERFQKIIDQYRDIASGEIVVDRFILFESILKKEGPLYLALQSFPLRKL